MSTLILNFKKRLVMRIFEWRDKYHALPAYKQYAIKYGIPLLVLLSFVSQAIATLLSLGLFIFAVVMSVRDLLTPKRNKSVLLSARKNILQIEEHLAVYEGIFIGRSSQSSRSNELRISEENRGLVIGPPGTGKTTFLISQILDWASQDCSFIVIDYKPEIYDLISKRKELVNHRIVRVNPLDKSADTYNPLNEVDDEMSMAELATAFIPEKSAENAIFSTYSRMIFEAISLHLSASKQPNSVPEIKTFISDHKGIKNSLEELESSPSQRAKELARSILETSENERFFASVMASFNEAMNIVSYPTIANSLSGDDVSLGMFNKFPTAFIIQLPESKKEVLAPLAAFYMTHILTWLIEHTDRQAVALFLDEIGNATKIPALVEKLNTVRSRKIPVWTYWQSIEQMQIYGQKGGEGANKILAACDFQMYFRLNDNETAEQVSKAIGQQDVDYVSASVIQMNATKNIQREPILEPGELREIEAGQAICLFRGMKWIGWAEPYYIRY